jgi:hypothetical protein
MTINSSKSLAHHQICPGLRVSSITMSRTGHWGGDYTEIETWIFSDIPEVESRQFHHRTEAQAVKFNRRVSALLYKAADKYIKETRERIQQLEQFAHEALRHLHDQLWWPDTQGRLTDEQWAEMKEEAKDFVSRHCPDGEFSVREIQITEGFQY